MNSAECRSRFVAAIGLIACWIVASGQPLLSIDAGVELRWGTVVGNTYQLQWASNSDGVWADLGEVVEGNGLTMTFRDPVRRGLRNYRVLEVVPGEEPEAVLPRNGGFERGVGGEAEDWNASGGESPERSDADARSGSYSMRSVLENAPSEATLSQSVRDGVVVPGESYDFSFWAKLIHSGPSYVRQYRVQWLDNGGGVIESTGLRNFSTPLGEWSEVLVPDLTAPVGADGVRFYFRFVTGVVPGGAGEVFVDDVALRESGGSVMPGPGQTNVLSVAAQSIAWVRWDTDPGVRYQPTSTVNLPDGIWEPLTSAIVGDGSTQEVSIAMGDARRFVRVEIPDSGVGTDIVELFDATTVLEPPTTEETAEALITRVGDRGRGRHAREDGIRGVGAGPLYDVYLRFYWEGRTVGIEIVDRVAMGGDDITINIASSSPLATRDFRAFFRGISTVAEYHHNVGAMEVGPNRYTTTFSYNPKERRGIRVGDRMEFEFSPFLDSPENGRANYYGTAMLYIVGEGLVPWEGRGALLDSYPLPELAWLGGKTTIHYPYSNEPEHLFKQMAGNLAPTNAEPFMLGRRLHHTNFEDGTHSEGGNPAFSDHEGKAGPGLINRSCVACHVNNGRALPPEVGEAMLRTVVKVGADASGTPHALLGSVLQPQSVGGVPEGGASISGYTMVEGQCGDGTPYTLRKPVYSFSGTTPVNYSVRVAPQLVGLGLLEAIGESTILALADPGDEDLDGVSGRAQQVVDPETGQTRLGRFGYKAGQSRLRHQVASALNTDMGVTTSVFPLLDGESTGGVAELGETELDYMTRYVAVLGVGARRGLDDPVVMQGEQLFASAQCVKCHVPEMVTSAYHPMAELRNQTIRPFTDMLLHDMGPGLADNMGEGEATGSEWRTAPLWSVGHTMSVSGGDAYLHDGRARSLEEAILWHGGEGEASKEAFRMMTAGERAALVAFLRAL